jgi:Bacterial Ig domain
MRINGTLVRCLAAFFGMMLFASGSCAAPTLSIKDVQLFRSGEGVSSLIEGGNGEIFGLSVRSVTGSTYSSTKTVLFKVDMQGNYSELFTFQGALNYSPGFIIKGNDDQIYMIIVESSSPVQKLGSKLYKLVGSQPTLIYDFGMNDDDTHQYPAPYIFPKDLMQKPDGSFSGTFFRTYDAENSISSGAFNLDTTGAAPDLKIVYEIPPINRRDRSSVFIPDQNGKYYELQKMISGIDDYNLAMREVNTNTDPVGVKVVHDFGHFFSGYSNKALTLFPAANGKFYGNILSWIYVSTADDSATTTSSLVEIDPAKIPALNVIKSTSGKRTYEAGLTNPIDSPDYPNLLTGFIQAANTKNIFFGIRQIGSPEARVIFKLDVSGAAPVYTEYPDLIIPNSVNYPILFANNAFYTTRVVPAADVPNTYIGTALVKLSITGIDLLPPANTAPVAQADDYNIRLKGRKPVTIAAPGLLKNDSDADGDRLSVAGIAPGKSKVVVPSGKNGKVEMYSDGRLVYTPPQRAKAPRVISFSYRATDGKAESNAAVVKISIIDSDCHKNAKKTFLHRRKR